jgi:hypothetical protein
VRERVNPSRSPRRAADAPRDRNPELEVPEFGAREAIAGKNARTLARDLVGMTQTEFGAAFKGSAAKRATLRGSSATPPWCWAARHGDAARPAAGVVMVERSVAA